MTADSFPYAPWATIADIPAEALDLQSKVLPATLDLALSLASTIMFNLTRLRWPGLAQITLYPENCRCGRPMFLLAATGLPGVEVEYTSGRYRPLPEADCICGGGCRRLNLNRRLIDIVNVTIAGDVVDAARYELQDGGRVLMWIPDPTDPNGRECWPSRQDLTVPVGDEGTWSVTAHVGKPVPPDAVKLAGIYAWELAMAMSRTSDSCRLSAKTRSASRKGATQVQTDPMVLVENGLTSLPEVDAWISAINSGQQKRRATVHRATGGRRIHTRGL